MSLRDTFNQDFEKAKAKRIEDLRQRFGKVIDDPRFQREITMSDARMTANSIEKAVDVVMAEPFFLRACKEAKVEPSRRQARKFYNGQGAAWTLFLAQGHTWEVEKL